MGFVNFQTIQKIKGKNNKLTIIEKNKNIIISDLKLLSTFVVANIIL
jgi:hypothetical protein